ncbi:hypothetical protein [Streptomyces sp. NPDC058701]|uniref:hypothetical protein n=1 Tax=Streptomyces sp. NPDC058701 TaxID=3346608 RepID=UPI00364D29F5
MSEPAGHKPSCICKFSKRTIDTLYVGIIGANYAVREDRNLSGLVSRAHTMHARRKRGKDDGGRPGA